MTAYFDTLVRIEQSRYYHTFSDAFAVYAASYSHPQSAHYQSPDVLRRMEAIVSRLLEVQHPELHVYLTGRTPFRHVLAL